MPYSLMRPAPNAVAGRITMATIAMAQNNIVFFPMLAPLPCRLNVAVGFCIPPRADDVGCPRAYASRAPGDSVPCARDESAGEPHTPIRTSHAEPAPTRQAKTTAPRALPVWGRLLAGNPWEPV